MKHDGLSGSFANAGAAVVRNLQFAKVKVGDDDIRFDNEGSGYSFKTECYLPAAATELSMTCRMQPLWNLIFGILIARVICYARKHQITEICHAQTNHA